MHSFISKFYLRFFVDRLEVIASNKKHMSVPSRPVALVQPEEMITLGYSDRVLKRPELVGTEVDEHKAICKRVYREGFIYIIRNPIWHAILVRRKETINKEEISD